MALNAGSEGELKPTGDSVDLFHDPNCIAVAAGWWRPFAVPYAISPMFFYSATSSCLPLEPGWVRSGETQYNKDGLLQGQGIDSSLSEVGVQQAEAAGLYLRDVAFTDVFASDMKRAKQTAEIILRNSRTCSNLDIVTDPSLKERSFGVAEGGQVENMKSMAKAAGQPVPEFTPPGGETVDQVKIRINRFLRFLFKQMAEHKDKIQPGDDGQPAETCRPPAGRPDDGVANMPAHALVVSHGAYMRVAVRYFFEELGCPVPIGADMAQVRSACPNTGMCRFVVRLKCCGAELLLSQIKCVFINRTDHITEPKSKN